MSSARPDPLQSALALHQAGQHAPAEAAYRAILAAHPRAAEAWHLLGVLLLQTNRPQEAATAIEAAIAIAPDKPDYFNHLGAAFGALGRHEAAVTALRRAVQLDPRAANGHYNLGTALRNAGDTKAAIASFRHAVAAQPGYAEAHYNLANTLRELNETAAAEAAYRAALTARPGYVKAMLNLGNLLAGLKRYDESLAVLREAVALHLDNPRCHLNLGTVLRDAGQFAAAVAELKVAVALDPNAAEAHNNLATALQSQADFAGAAEAFQTALRLNPQLPDAHFSFANHLLRSGDLDRGFAEYEWRWKCKGYTNRTFPVPRWQGEPLAGRTILLHAEQGLGDTLHFVRYVQDVKQRGGTTIVECQAALHRLLAGTPGIDRLIAPGESVVAELECPLLSLPGVLGLSMNELARGSYLQAEPERIEGWKHRLESLSGHRVGICWQGNKQHLFDSQRSFRLERLASVAAIPGVRLVSLQHGPGSEQISQVDFAVHELGEELDRDAAFLDTAAVIKNLDLVITADTAIAHLAGGLGMPVWIALSAHSDWRWFEHSDESPWYPSARLFRQSQLDCWEEVFANIACEVGCRSR